MEADDTDSMGPGEEASDSASASGDPDFTQATWREHCEQIESEAECAAQTATLESQLSGGCGWAKWRVLKDLESCELGDVVVEECNAVILGPEGEPVGRRCVPGGEYACRRDDWELPALSVTSSYGCEPYIPCLEDDAICDCACEFL